MERDALGPPVGEPSTGARTGLCGVAAALLAVVLLALPPGANATHDGSGYWFHQGNLPKADGTYTVHHEGGCCGGWVVVRMSWEAWTHDMKFIFIRWDGGWEGYWAQSGSHEGEWDIPQVLPADTYRRGGCQNPGDWNWWAVWTNCHVRNTLAG
jgi:hypothetical protein